MTLRNALGCLALALTVGTPATGLARDGDEEACAGKEAGDPCTRARGDEGVCQPDDSDPDVLKCDDDPYPRGGGAPRPDAPSDADGTDGSTDDLSAASGANCATGGGAGAGVLVALGALAVVGRRRARG